MVLALWVGKRIRVRGNYPTGTSTGILAAGRPSPRWSRRRNVVPRPARHSRRNIEAAVQGGTGFIRDRHGNLGIESAWFRQANAYRTGFVENPSRIRQRDRRIDLGCETEIFS